MGKMVAMFDLDKTVFKSHSFFGLVDKFVQDEVVDKEVGKQVEGEYRLYKAGKQNYSLTANNLLKIFARGLAGQIYDLIKGISRKYFDEHEADFFPYFAKILPVLKRTHKIYLVTTNTQAVAEAVQHKFGLDGYISSEFEVREGKFTGEVKETLADGKQRARELIEKYGFAGSIAVGDSGNDIEMLEQVEFPVCINPDERLEQTAKERGWRIAKDNEMEGVIVELSC